MDLWAQAYMVIPDRKGQMARKVVEQHLFSSLFFCGYKIPHFFAKFFRKKIVSHTKFNDFLKIIIIIIISPNFSKKDFF